MGMDGLYENIKIYIAYLTNNRGGKREDVHGRTYRQVYKKFGHKEMLKEYKQGNSWYV